MSNTASDDTISGELSEEERRELVSEFERKRSLRGWATVLVAAVAVLFSMYQVLIAARGFVLTVPVPLYGELRLAALQLLQVNAIHVTFALVLTFLLFPPTTGDGLLSRRLGRIVPAIERRFGHEHPLTRVAVRIRSAVRWAVVDCHRERVTPVDLAFVLVAILAGSYIVTDFTEIRRMRALGMNAGRTLPEVYPSVEPAVVLLDTLGIPLSEVSLAFVLGVVGVLLVLEATRRALGVHLMVLVASFIVYARFGYLIPQGAPYVGVLSIQQLGWDVIVQNLWYNTENGVFGIPVTVSVQFIYIFILFGAFLEMSGAGKWFIDLAYSVTGTRKGGPAKASILASGFMGTISGSSIANTVTTGAFTIPLMKRTGYRPEFAGGVEASASSGGQILPPVMGAAAFLIVEYTGTPYAEVIVAASIPAVVFFFGVWVMVHLEASRTNIGGLAEEDVVDLRHHLRRGWFYLVPLILLLYYLIVERLSVARSAWFTLVAIVALIGFIAAYNERTRLPLVATIAGLFVVELASFAVYGVGPTNVFSASGVAPMAPWEAGIAAIGRLGWIVIAVSTLTLLARPNLDAPLADYDDRVDSSAEAVADATDRHHLQDNAAFRFGTFVLQSMDAGGRTATTVVIAVAAAGVIPGVISATGLGPNLTALLLAIAGKSLVVLLVLTAIASIILGMGMPTTVTYIILVSMLGPAIASPEFGIPILAAHLFILYFGVIADITPPVAVAAYAASGIAKSDQFQTGVTAFSLSLNKAIVPFAFVFAPGIMLLEVTDTGFRVLSPGDVTELGYFLPEVLAPILGVFVGVIALGATVIGYLYTDAEPLERAGFAVSALLLMAPLLAAIPTFELLGSLGVTTLDPSVSVALVLRLAGGGLFALLALRNRRDRDTPPEPTSESGVESGVEVT